MGKRLIFAVVIATALASILVGVARAHGEPVITVEPNVVAAGGQVTVAGSEVEPGEVFRITLEGLGGSIPLGETTVTGEGEEGEFRVTLTIPSDSPAGSYTVRAATEGGELATADLAVTAPSDEASAEPATVQEPTGELHPLDRSRPIGEVVAAVVVITVSAVVGFVLVRQRT